MKNFSRVLATLTHLKPIQLYGRISHFFKRGFFRIQGRRPFQLRAGEIKKAMRANVSPKFDFSFLNVETCYDASDIRWNDGMMEKLWRYNLNYFDFLQSSDSPLSEDDRLFLILDWIEKNPDDLAESWEPFVISKRLVNWVNWFESRRALDSEFSIVFADSVFFQTRRLFMDLEFHNQANHLFENLKTLMVASFFLLRTSESQEKKGRIRKWLWFSISNLRAQIDEQILDDGGHYELSPMYHQEILHGIKEIRRTARMIMKSDKMKSEEKREIKGLSEDCDSAIPRMEDWLSCMTHPDGYIALFNDSAFSGNQNDQNPLSDDKSLKIRHLRSSGYFTCRWGKGNYLVMDCGNPSPDFQPGHSHCDGLSFELSLNGKRIVVDAGCGSYQNPRIRTFCRGTSSHNVPWLSPYEQSDIYDFFRIGARSEILESKVLPDQSGFHAILRDFTGNIFSRRISILKSPAGSANATEVIVEDTLDTRNCDGVFESLIHFSPAIQIRATGEKSIEAFSNGLYLTIKIDSSYMIEESLYYPEFGLEKKNQMLRLVGGKEKQIRYAIRLP